MLKGKQIDIENIVAKSVEDELGIPTSWCTGDATESGTVSIDQAVLENRCSAAETDNILDPSYNADIAMDLSAPAK